MANNPPPTPRLTAPYLSHFPSQTVRLIGKVLQLRGETAVVDAGGEVIVHLNRVRVVTVSISTISRGRREEVGRKEGRGVEGVYRAEWGKREGSDLRRRRANVEGRAQDSHLIPGNAVEIVGKVQGDLSVRVLMATDFGANLDFAAVEKVVECSMRWKEIFYDAGES